MGENGLVAEEEYKWGHYNYGESDLSPSPLVPAPHLMIPRHIHFLLDVLPMPPSLGSTARDSPGVHLMRTASERP